MTGYLLVSTFSRRFSTILFVVLFLLSIQVGAQGDLLLFPKRIVFEGSQKSQTLNLANSGKDTVKYTISVVQIRMNKEGGFETITQPDSGQNFADKYFRFFPRSVVLPPNEAQTVKIQLINTGEMVPGEYRSHLYFRSEPDKKPLGEEKQDKTSTAISIDLKAVFGISIPVIIRVGATATSIILTDPYLDWKNKNTPSVRVNFNRVGNTSSYGDVSVDYVSPAGKTTQVAKVKGMAVYAPNPQRQINLPLTSNPEINYRQGKLHITYTTPADTKSVLLAETELTL